MWIKWLPFIVHLLKEDTDHLCLRDIDLWVTMPFQYIGQAWATANTANNQGGNNYQLIMMDGMKISRASLQGS